MIGVFGDNWENIKMTTGSRQALILSLSGDLTFGHSFAALRDCLSALLDRGERNIAFELSEVSAIDSSGIGELIHAFNRVASFGGRLFILNPPAKVERLFEIAGLGPMLGSDSSKAKDSDESAVATRYFLDSHGSRLIWS